MSRFQNFLHPYPKDFASLQHLDPAKFRELNRPLPAKLKDGILESCPKPKGKDPQQDLQGSMFMLAVLSPILIVLVFILISGIY